MLGETTLAMLYVPLFFYLFELLTERLRGHGGTSPAPTPDGHPPAHGGHGAKGGE
jgi:multidrug efflux pump